MFRAIKPFSTLAATTFLVAGLAASPLSAKHQWKDYHLEDEGAASMTITNYYCMGGGYLSYNDGTHNFDQVNADWTQYVLDNGGGEVAIVSDSSCPIGTGTGATDPDASAFNNEFDNRTATYGPDVAFSLDGPYGNNGWLGLAVINLSADGTHHIAHGEVFLNTSYMSLSYYDTPRTRTRQSSAPLSSRVTAPSRNRPTTSALVLECGVGERVR